MHTFAITTMRLSLPLFCWVFLSCTHVFADAKPEDVELKKQSGKLDAVKPSELVERPVAETVMPPAQKANELLREGTLHHNNGYLPQAEQCFRQALILDPRNSNGYFNLGAIAEARGDLITALGHYRAGLNVSPGDKEIGDAVSSIESQLKQMSTSDTSSTRLARSTPSLAHPVTAPGLPSEPVSSSAGPPFAPPIASGGQPTTQSPSRQFQLKSSSSRTIGQTQAVSPNPAPVVSVTQPSRKKAIAKAALGAAVSIGLSTALRSSGLHCPVCRVVRFGF